MSTSLQPVEDLVFVGLVQRFQQVFDCPPIITTNNDKTKSLERFLNGKEVTYPYIFLTPSTFSPNIESYSTNVLARRGIIAVVNEGFAQTVRILPVNFDFEVEFITNRFQGLAQGSVMAFIRRWLFARRCGYLKFNINYGRLEIKISLQLSDSVPFAPMENKTEQEASYKVSTSMTVHGYMSEPELGTQGVIQEMMVNGVPLNSDGSVPGSQFFPFQVN